MRRSMRRSIPRHPRAIQSSLTCIALAALLALAGCSSTSSTGTTGTATVGATGTATTSAHPTVTPHSTQTVAWIQRDASGNPQVWDSIGGALPHQVSHNPGTDPCGESAFGPPVLSPDGAHIAVAGGAGCGDGQSHGSVYIVNTASGALTEVPSSNALTEARSVGWLDNSTIWIAQGNLATYVLGASSPTNLPGTDGAIEAVVRGSTLFYLAGGGSPTSGLTGAIHRYSLTTHSDLGSPVSTGGFDMATDRSPGDFRYQGWDASPDGAHIVYQVTTAAAVTDANPAGIGGSRVYYANADGSGATQILQYMTTNSMITMRLSPDGSQVAVTSAEPAPDIISGCVASPGTHTDPCFHSYGLPPGYQSFGYPVWTPDGHSFIVSADATDASLYIYTVGSPSSAIYQNGAYQAWAN